MKQTGKILLSIIFIAVSSCVMAQNSTSFFEGRWEITGDSPMGEVIFNMKLERVDGVLTGEIQREGETNPIKFSKVVEKENEVTVFFHSSSGYDVDFNFKKTDDKKLTGTAMDTYTLKGVRTK